MAEVAPKLHLREPVLRVHEPEAVQRVVFRRGENVRDGVDVADNLDGSRQSRDRNVAVEERWRAPDIQVHCDTRDHRHRQQACEGFEQSATHGRIIVKIAESRFSDCKLHIEDCGVLKSILDRLYADFNDPNSATDPIQIVRRFERPEDREVVGFCAAALAFGRVATVLRSIERLLAFMGDRPATYVRAFEPDREAKRYGSFVHRWTRGSDLVALLWLLKQMIDRTGSIEAFFVEGHHAAAEDVGPALESFSARALVLDRGMVDGRVPSYFFPRPSAGSACKRLNLFLRWMVRRDALDLGVWSRVSPSALIVPLDTHVIRVGRCLRLTHYASPGWAMARDITTSLRRLDPDDPVKYDYALCHLGMMSACDFDRAQKDACPLRGVCRPRARTRRPFRRPSDRP